MFYIVKVNYDLGAYTKDDVALMVDVNFITADEYKQIVGEEYQKEEEK